MKIPNIDPTPGQRFETMDTAKRGVAPGNAPNRDGMSGTNRLTGGRLVAHGTAVMRS